MKTFSICCFILFFIVSTHANAGESTVEDPIADFVNMGVHCLDSNVNILRYQDQKHDHRLLLSTDRIVGNKIGQWWAYRKIPKGYQRDGSETRNNGPWIWDVEQCSCNDFSHQKCEWSKWRQQ